MTEYVLWPVETGPGSTAEDAPINLATEFTVTATAWLVGVRFWRPDTSTDGTIRCRCWDVTDLVGGNSGVAVPGTDGVYSSLTASGWQDCRYPTAVPLSTSKVYRASVLFPSGFPATANYWSGGGPGAVGITHGPLHAPSRAASTGGTHQGSLDFSAVLDFPANGSGNGACYWVTPIISDVDPAQPPESHEGDGVSALALGSISAGLKIGTGGGAAALTLGSGAAGSSNRSGDGSVPLTLGVDTSGSKTITGDALVSPLTLGASSMGSPTGPDVPALTSAVLCSPWATPADVPGTIRAELADEGVTDEQLADALLRASEILWALSGRVWYGAGCEETADVRSQPPMPGMGIYPYEESWGSCGCWTVGSWERGRFLLPVGFAHTQAPFAIKLPRAPLTAITAVTVGGLPFADYSARRTGWVERTDGQPWGVCDGDVSITYTYGDPPPAGGRDAAITLGVEIARDWVHSGLCRLPARTSSVTRQGISFEVESSQEFLDKGLTGIYSVDLWLRAVNPYGVDAGAIVWSPDVPVSSIRRT